MANSIQFNSKSCAEFRKTMEKYYNARHSIADLMNRKNDTIKALQAILDSNATDQQAIIEGTYAGKRTSEEITADNASLLARLDTAKSDYTDAKVKFDKAIESGVAIYTDALHKSASEVVANFGDADAMTAWHNAIATVLRDNGVSDATADNVARFDFLVNVKNNSAKKVYKSNSLVGTSSRSQAATLFMNALAEYLVSCGAIKPFQHKYVPVSEKNKKNK